MSDLYDLDPLSPTERRLLADAAFGPLNYPDDLARRDQYFREGFALIQTVNQPEKVRMVLTSYVHYVTDPALKAELETYLHSLPKSEDPPLAGEVAATAVGDSLFGEAVFNQATNSVESGLLNTSRWLRYGWGWYQYGIAPTATGMPAGMYVLRLSNRVAGRSISATIPSRGTMPNLSSLVKQLKRERDRVAKQLSGMEAALRAFAGVYSGSTNGKRQISAVGRRRIAAAQRARWAKVRGRAKVATPKRTMSTASRRKIAPGQPCEVG